MSAPPKTQRRARPASLRRKLLDYFEANPGEELTTEDVCVKFGVNNARMRNTIYDMRKAGEVWSGFIVRRVKT